MNKIRERWTILKIKESTINVVKRYAKENRINVSRAVEDLIEKGRKK